MNPLFQAKHLVAAAAALVAMGSAQALTLDGNEYTCTGTCGTDTANGVVTAPPAGGSYGFVSTNGSAVNAGVAPVVHFDGGQTWANGSKAVSGVFSTSGTIAASFNFVSTDGDGFADFAWARVIDATNNNPTNNTVAWLFTAGATNSGRSNVVPGELGLVANPAALITNYGSYQFSDLDPKKGDVVEWSGLGSDTGNGATGSGMCFGDKASACGFTGWLNAQVTVAAGNYRLEVGVVNFADGLYDSGLAFDVSALAAPVPEPGTMPMMLAALGVFGAFARRRMNPSA